MRRYAISKKVGRNIRRARKDSDLTQEELADKVGIHVTTLGRIERGESNPPLSRIDKIAKVLSVPTKSLLS